MRYLSHEMRNPLNSMFVGLELIKKKISRIPENEEIFLILDDMTVASYKSIEVLDTLLSVEQINIGVTQLERSLIPVSSIINENIAQYSAKVK